VQICLHSSCVIVLDLDVFFLLVLCFYIVYFGHVSSFVPYYSFYGHLSVQEFLPWRFRSMSEIN